jgi:pyridoxamine 5'-phosphate oxidase
MVVATVDDGGLPVARLLVLRGASRRLGRVWFHTDRRSEKVGHLRARPHLSAVAYDPREQVQIILRASAVVHEDDPDADEHWEQFRIAAERSGDGPCSEACAIVPDLRLTAIRTQGAASEVNRATFALIEAKVESILWMQVRGEQQRRAVLRPAAGWAAEPLGA